MKPSEIKKNITFLNGVMESPRKKGKQRKGKSGKRKCASPRERMVRI